MNRLALFDAKREELQKECATLSERSQAKEIAMLAVYDADGDGKLSSSENEQLMEDYRLKRTLLVQKRISWPERKPSEETEAKPQDTKSFLSELGSLKGGSREFIMKKVRKLYEEEKERVRKAWHARPSRKGDSHIPREFYDSSAKFQCDLGRDSQGYNAGLLYFKFSSPTPEIFSRKGLNESVNINDKGITVYLDEWKGEKRLAKWNREKEYYEFLQKDEDASYFEMPPVSGETEGACLRRIYAVQCVIDLVDIDYGYEIRYYYPEFELPAEDASTLPPLTGEPFRIWRIRNPSEDPDKLDVIEVTSMVKGRDPVVDTMEYSPETKGWTHRQGSGSNASSNAVGRKLLPNGDILRFREYRDAEKEVVKYSENVCHVFPWDEEILEERVGKEKPRVKQYSYYDDEADESPNYGQKKEEVEWDGAWKRYTYAAENAIATEATPWLDSPRGAPDDQCRVVETIREGNFRTEIERIQGIEVSRTYSFNHTEAGQRLSGHIRTSVPGAAIDDPSNEAYWSCSLEGWDTPFDEEEIYSCQTDGRGLLRSFVQNSDGTWTVTTERGVLGATGILSGQRTIEKRTADDELLSSTVIDIESGLTISSQSYERDIFGRPLVTRHEDDTTETYVQGTVSTISHTSREGITETKEYDSKGRIASRTIGDLTTNYTYNAIGRTLAESLTASLMASAQPQDASAQTQTTRYEYNEYGEKTAEISPTGERTEYRTEIIDGHRTETTVYPDGSTAVTTYHLDGTIASVSGTAVSPVSYFRTVNSDGTMTTRTVYGEGEWVESTQDLLGRTIKTAYPDGTYSATTYDAQSRILSSTAPTGCATLYQYDDPTYGDITAIDMDGDGKIGLVGPDIVEAKKTDYVEMEGQVMLRTRNWRWLDASSGTPALVSQSLQSRNNRLNLHEEDGIQTRVETTLRGNGIVEEKTIADGKAPVLSTFRNHRPVSRASESQGVTTYEYDAFENPIGRTIAANGVMTQFREITDSSQHTVSQEIKIGEESRITRRTVNLSDSQEEVTFPDGAVCQSTFNAQGKTILECGDTHRVAYEYDAQGRTTAMTSWRNPEGTGNGDRSAFAYNERGQIIRQTYADGSHEEYSYDANGNLVTKTSPRGIVTTYSYDNAGRRTTVSFSDGTPSISCTYDRGGRLASVTDAAGTRSFSYDAAGNRLSETQPHLPGLTITLGYDRLHRRTAFTLAKAETVLLHNDYSYDAFGRLKEIVSGQNRLEFLHRQHGNALAGIRWFRNDTEIAKAERSFDVWDNVARIAFGGPTGELSSLSYAYDLRDRRTRIHLPDGTAWSYEYDRLGQLTAAARFSAEGKPIPGEAFRFEYDGAGNRTLSEDGASENLRRYSTNALNLYTAIDKGSAGNLSYDADGNLLAYDGWTYVWNAQNRLVSATKGTLRLEFAYDYLGRRFEKKVFQEETLVKHILYAYDNDNLVAEFNASNGNALENSYLTSGTPILRNNSEFLVSDASQNIVAIMNDKGVVTDTYLYAPFGTCTHNGTSTNPFRFKTLFQDDETGLCYAFSQYYSPDIGRGIGNKGPAAEQYCGEF